MRPCRFLDYLQTRLKSLQNDLFKLDIRAKIRDAGAWFISAQFCTIVPVAHEPRNLRGSRPE